MAALRGILLLAIAALAAAAWAGEPRDAAPTAELLVDLARDYGLTRGVEATPADVRHVRTLLRAALRVNPRATDAYVWLYELARLSGDEAEAARTLREIVAADPAQEGAFARWLEAELQSRQTMEDRAAWLREQLARPDLPPALGALVHAHLGVLALQSLDARQARAELDEALRLDPFSPEGAALALALLPKDAPPAERLRAALQVLRSSPLRLDAAVAAGAVAQHFGFAEQAERFFRHAEDVYRAEQSGAPLPPEWALALARSRIAGRQYGDAIALVQEVIASDPTCAAEAGMLLHWLLVTASRNEEAQRARELLARRFAPIREPAEWPVNEVAQAAWFYCSIDSQPQRGLMLAESAAARAGGDPFVARVLGWAQAVNNRTDDARKTLAPVARQDALAAYQLARILRDSGDESQMRKVLDELEAPPPPGPAAELIAQLRPATASQPAARRWPQIADALAEFDRDTLTFYQDSSAFLEATLDFADRSPSPGEPWLALLTLTNKAKFPITLGPDGMLNPVVVLSVSVEGDQPREFPAAMTIAADRYRVVPPGASVRIRRTIDVGPVRRVSRQAPQQLLRVTVSGILDGQREADGTWKPAPGGQRLRNAYLNRVPAGVEPEALHALFAALSGESDLARFRAIEQMAELLGEQQRAALKRLTYRPEAVPAERMHQALEAALRSGSWEVRVRALDALQVAGLDKPLVDAASGCLKHEHWLVRLMAVRLLARQGSAFGETATRLAKGDDDELVRTLAGCYLEEWKLPNPASQPADAGGG